MPPKSYPPLAGSPKWGEYSRGNLTIMKSNIPNSGYGVYAMKDFKKGAVVARYRGKKIKKSQINDSSSLYLLTNFEGQTIDGANAWEKGYPLAPYIQHLFPKNEDELGLQRNVQFEEGDKGTLWAVATQPIWAGQELFTDYGDGYWETVGYPPGYEPKKSKRKRRRDSDTESEDGKFTVSHSLLGDGTESENGEEWRDRFNLR